MSLPTYAVVLAWIKAAILGWIVRVGRPVAGATHSTNIAQGVASVGQQIGGSGYTVIQHIQTDASLVAQLIDRVSARDRELGQRDQIIAVQSAEMQALRQQAVETVLVESQKRGDNRLADFALRDLQSGSIDLAQSLLRAMEKDSFLKREKKLAARLAREQAALWLGRNVEAAHEAFERAHHLDPDDLSTLGHLVELAKKCKSLTHAAYWADLALRHTEKLASSDSRNVMSQTDVVISCWKLASVLPYLNSQQASLKRGLHVLNQLQARAGLSQAQLSWIKAFDERLGQLRSTM